MFDDAIWTIGSFYMHENENALRVIDHTDVQLYIVSMHASLWITKKGRKKKVIKENRVQ